MLDKKKLFLLDRKSKICDWLKFQRGGGGGEGSKGRNWRRKREKEKNKRAKAKNRGGTTCRLWHREDDNEGEIGIIVDQIFQRKWC